MSIRGLGVSLRRMTGAASGNRGQTLVMVGVAMIVLFALGAMALDVGQVLWSREAQQNAADAAALAGVRELPEDPTEAVNRAIEYAASNGFVAGVDGVTVTAAVSTILDASNASDNALTVTITRVVPPGLRAAVGAGNITVPARAMAVVAPAVPVCDVWPWGIEEDTLLYGDDGTIYDSGEDGLPYGKKVVLKVPPQNQVAPGNFLSVRVLGQTEGGTSVYRDTIETGMCIANTETIWTEPGNMGNNTAKAVLTADDSAIKQCDPCYDESSKTPDSVYWEVSPTDPYTESPFTTEDTPYPFALGCPCGNDCGNTGPPDSDDPFPGIVLPSTTRVGIVPILAKGTYDEASGNNGSFEAEIVDFAAFYLIGLESDGSQDFVVGAFLQKVWVKGGTPDFGGDLDGPVGAFLWK